MSEQTALMIKLVLAFLFFYGSIDPYLDAYHRINEIDKIDDLWEEISRERRKLALSKFIYAAFLFGLPAFAFFILMEAK